MRVHLKSIRDGDWLRFLAVGVVSGTVGWAQALSLGSSQGTAYIGKAFTSSFSVNLDAAVSNPRDNCLSALLHYGDARIMDARLKVKPAADGRQSRITVSSNTPVNEPIVSVTVKGGCNAVFQRKYTFFSELSGRPAPSVAATAPAVRAPSTASREQVTEPVTASVFSAPQNYSNASSGSTVSSQPKAVQPSAGVSGSASGTGVPTEGVGAVFEVPPEVDYSAYLAQRREQAQKRSTRSETRAQKKKRAGKSRPARRSRAAAAGSAKPVPQRSRARATATDKKQAASVAVQGAAPAMAGTPRLTLSSIDWTQDAGEVALRPSMELLSPVATDETQREQARQLWRQISSGGGEAILAADSERAVNADFLTLTKAIEDKEQEIAALKTELEQVKEGREAAGLWKWLPYILGILLLIAAALALRFWNALRQTAKDEQERRTWWRRVDGDDPAASGGGAGSEPQSSREGGLRYQSKVMPGGGSEGKKVGAAALATTAVAAGSDDAQAVEEKESSSTEFSDFEDELSARDALESSAKAEELFDVQQQADFFLALGQEEQAIEILETYISEKPHASALAYLDLFGIYHSLGKEQEFIELRGKFNSLFNAEVPEYENYRMDSRGLESYENVVARIQSHWGTPKAVQLIEESVFREPDEEETSQAFDPLAYRELLLLYGIAAEVAGTDSDLVSLGEKRFGESGFNIEADELEEAAEDDYSSTKIQGLTRTPQAFRPVKKDHILSNVALVSSTAVKDMTTIVDQTLDDLEGMDESSDLDFDLSAMGAADGTENPAVEMVDLDLGVAADPSLDSAADEVELEFELAVDGQPSDPDAGNGSGEDDDEKGDKGSNTSIDFDLV